MKYHLKKLKNGVRVLTVPMHSLESATVTVWVKVGSRYEDKKKAGLSHFLEHMVFKGSKKRPTAKEIADAVDSIGAEINAGTSKEWTNFYIKTPVASIETAFDVLSDMVLNPILGEEEIEREKGVIIEEMRVYKDTPLWSIGEYFETLIFQGNNLGREIIGTEKTVSGATRDDFVRYRKLHYSSNNIVITVAGGIDRKKAESLAKKYFSSVGKGKRNSFGKFRETQKSPKLLVKYQKNEQGHLVIGFPAGKRGDKDRFTEAVIAAILGGGMSSRMFTEVREKRGLAYAVKTAREKYSDIGYIETYAGVDLKRVNEAIKVIIDQYFGLSEGRYPVSKAELKKAKDFMKGQIALSLEDTKNVNSFFGEKELLLGKAETPEEVLASIDKVTMADVERVSRNVFKKNKLNLAIVGPFKGKSTFEKIIRS